MKDWIRMLAMESDEITFWRRNFLGTPVQMSENDHEIDV